MSISYFIMPDEQLAWLQKQISELNLWCWIRPVREQDFLLKGIDLLADLELTAGNVLDYNLGDSNVSEPMLEHSSGRTSLAFVRSQCVQYAPSKLIDGEILLQGDMGIANVAAYNEIGIDSEGVRRLYKRLRTALRLLISREHVITQVTTSSVVKEWRDTYISPGAIEFWRNGGLLKQFIEGPVVFGVREKIQRRERR